MNRILFAAGGTAGHIEPAWAVSQIWKKRYPGDELAFLGTKSGLEVDLIPNRDRKSTRLNSSHIPLSRMPSSA